jgi:hypothetical protein
LHSIKLSKKQKTMRKLYTWLAGILLTTSLIAQDTKPDSTHKPNDSPVKKDTLQIGGIIIIKKRKDKDSKRSSDSSVVITRRKRQTENISTNFCVIDLGFTNYTNNTNYNAAIGQGLLAPGMNSDNLKLVSGKSVNE